MIILYLLVWALVLSVASVIAVYCTNTYIQPTMSMLVTDLTSQDVLPMLCLIYTCMTLIVLLPKLLRVLDDKLVNIVYSLAHQKLCIYVVAFVQTLGLSLTLTILLTVYYLVVISLTHMPNTIDWSNLLAMYNQAYIWDDFAYWSNVQPNGVELSILNKCSPVLYTGVSQNSDSDSQSFIPWYPTLSLSNGVKGLNRMYDSLSDNCTLKSYLTEHCAFLLNELTGYTDIPTAALEPVSLKTSPHTVKLGPTMSKAQFNSLNSVAGVYIFFDPDTNSVSQCGSSINLQSRLYNHYTLTKEHHKDFYQYAFTKAGGLNAYWWNPIWTTPNWEKDYMLKYSDASQEDALILRSFLQQYIRSVEQAISSYCKPTFWKGTDINTWHVNWQPGNILTKGNDGFATLWQTRTEEIYSQDSIKQAAYMLDISMRSVERAANCVPPYWIDTPNYGEVSITIPNKPMKGPYNATYDKEYNTLVDVNTLQTNKYYLYSPDMIQLDVGPFDNITEVNKAIGVNEDRQNLRWVNKMHLIKGSIYSAGVYVVCNRVSRMTPVTVTVDGVCYEFDSMSKASVFVYGSKRGMDKIIQRYIIHGKPYIYKDKTYIIEYVNLTDLLRYKEKYGL